MNHSTLELDAAGTPLGAVGLWASARDWARLGQLYVDDGVVGGVRILPVGWVDYTARLTPGSEAYGYGAGVWTNRGNSAGAQRRPHFPPDSFMARGHQGQYAIIIPSRRIVIVRMGPAFTPFGEMPVVDQLVGDVLAALPS